jgi:YVTN family beta-propeller protein
MRRFHCFVFAVCLSAALPSVAQTLLDTVPVGQGTSFLWANPVTNKIYVNNPCGNDSTCNTLNSTVTVINGATDTTKTVNVGMNAQFLVINQATNKIYVSNRRDNTVSVIDGNTDTVIKVIPVGSHPVTMDADFATNKIYVANTGNGAGNTVSVIDGSSDTVTATVTVGWYPSSVAVNPASHKVFVANFCGNDPNCLSDGGALGTVTIIDESNNNTQTVTVGI